MLYPLKFNPILKEMIWGGRKIPQTLEIDVDADSKIGEDYVISGLPRDQSVVKEGPLAGTAMISLIEKYQGDLLGQKVYEQFGTNFPLLIKFIDANDDLSIQVHPDDAMARAEHDSFGKTEMWYVMGNEPGATLVSGFSKVTSAEEFTEMHNNGQLMELMKSYPTAEGDTFFIPAGKVHSIGRGNLIAEIQQTSDITYRIYDFDRRDKEGNPRQLHHELAMKAMDFWDDQSGKVAYTLTDNQSVNLASCPYFTTNIIRLNGAVEKDYSSLDSFIILINVGGNSKVTCKGQSYDLNAMEAILIPASCKNITLDTESTAKLLEVHIG